MALEVRQVPALSKIPATAWDALAHPDFPFHRHAFLQTLEETASVGEKTGWIPRHFTVWDNDQLIAALPCYEKIHSYGEYIFDWEWARAYAQNGIPYYPKLLAAIPFTPATGPKILLAPSADGAVCSNLLIAALKKETHSRGMSSAHSLFLTGQEPAAFAENGFLIRHTFQFHWENAHFADFPAFLDSLKSRKRKQISRERRQLSEERLDIRMLTGPTLEASHGELLHRCYLSTVEKMGGIPYLSPDFYPKLITRMPDAIVLAVAYRGEKLIAAAVHFRGQKTLFGRHWGCLEDVRNLHFELCYYQAIEWAIREGLQRVEAGAQGEHKVQRGYLPAVTVSAHWIEDPRFRKAIGDFVEKERAAVEVGLTDFEGSPFTEP